MVLASGFVPITPASIEAVVAEARVQELSAAEMLEGGPTRLVALLRFNHPEAQPLKAKTSAGGRSADLIGARGDRDWPAAAREE